MLSMSLRSSDGAARFKNKIGPFPSRRLAVVGATETTNLPGHVAIRILVLLKKIVVTAKIAGAAKWKQHTEGMRELLESGLIVT